ncbi:MAG: hypothetical protein DRR06_11980 [Gammaproteobacteria bacterium]|nr:MAG: hypothetical protein DRR06_11980 [Gammaproteobacteria bacterium]RLA50498.1 MAG: hypothetical protein DRR42_13005 [Gammaproteobacteria bacterium]
MSQRMLEGFKVVDFTHVVAGPHATKILAEHGAEVIKIEPLYGELARTLPLQREGRSGYFVQHNIGKKTMAIDISSKEGQDICHGLIKQADVVVENFAPGVMKNNNLDWETLKAINPDLIMCSISCFGQDGPLANLPGFDWIGQSYAGIIDLLGKKDDTPVFGDFAFGDVATGVHAYGAIVTALMHRLRGGSGQHIDISLIEVLFSFHELSVQLFDSTGGQMLPTRAGADHYLLAAAGIFKCQDRYLFIVGLNQWAGLTKAIGRDDMANDPRFKNPAEAGQYKDEINGAIQDWLDTVESVDKALEILQANRVACAPILNIAEFMEHPHVKERGCVRTIKDDMFGEIRIPRTPLRFSEFPEPPDLRAGTLGQYNREILRERLSYSEQQIADLETAGIIGSKNI